MELKILSFNIRCANDPDGHSIPERAPRVAEIIKANRPDIVGMQEYHRRWEASWSRLEDPDYAEMIVDRGDGEGLVLRWRKDRLQALKTGHFWFGDDPGVPSADWDEKYHKARICAYAVLQDILTEKVLLYMNVHYGFGAQGHIKNARLLRSYARQLGDYPLVIAGDFNMHPETPGYFALTEWLTDVNMATQRLTDITYHGYGLKESAVLDYCFAGNGITPRGFSILKDTFEGKYPSDHYPIFMDIEL